MNIAIFISILYLPWWITLLSVIALLIFNNAYEVIFWGMFADALYGAQTPLLLNVQYVMTLLFFILFMLAIGMKKKIILYN